MKLKSWPTKVKRRLFIFALVLCGAGVLFFFELKKIQSEPISAWIQETNADCAIVLTGGPGRIREGFALLQRHQVQTLIVSGVNPSAALKDLVTPWEWIWGIDEEHVVLEKNSRTTYGNAAQSLSLAEALRCRDVLLVTSQTHMYRSYRTFVAVFPHDIQVHKYAISASRAETSIFGLATEVVKSLFYSIWAY